jgi:hypothetical protein
MAMRTILLAGIIGLSAAGAAHAESPPVLPPGTPAPAAAAPCPAPVEGALATLTEYSGSSGPRLWATGDYMVMWYTPMRTPPLIQAVPSAFVGSTSPDVVTTVFPENNRVNFGAFNGLRGFVGVGFDRFGVEVGGFVLERLQETGSLFTNGTPFAVAQGYIAAGSGVPTSLFASLPGEYSGGVAAAAESRLWGVEGNMRWSWYAFISNANDLILGFRYLDLQESLAIESPSFFPDGDVITVRDSIRTRNMFYGGQLGFNGRLGGFDRGLGLDLSTKGAVGGVAQRADLVGSNSFISAGVDDTEAGGLYARGSNAGSFSRSKIAYLHDVDVKLTYNFNPYIQVSFGYSLIYLSSVMRPGNAIDPVVNDNIRFVAAPTPSNLDRPAFSWRAEELVVQGMTFGARVQY